ncbi:Camk protein kinase [Globisporangium polare]
MGAALVKRCFMGDDVVETQYDARRRSSGAPPPSSRSRPSDSTNAHANARANARAVAELNARRNRQLRQLELQMQQLKQQQQLAPLVPSPMALYTAPSAGTSAPGGGGGQTSRKSGAVPTSATTTPLSMTSSYSTTMSESSFVGSQPQDDEILDMVMASAGLAFHPTQQWNRSSAATPPLRPQQNQNQYQPALSSSLPASSSSAPPSRSISRRGSMNSFRSLLPEAYTLQEVLGTGTTSTCYRCERRVDGAVFACKVIDKRRLAFSSQKRHDIAFQLRREVDVLRRVDHPNIAKLEEAFENDAYLILIMELLDGGELFDAIVEKGRFSEREAIQVARAVLSAMQYMHSLGVVHRDLKPENMLLALAPGGSSDSESDDGNSEEGEQLIVKIIDFGFAKFMAGENATTTSFLGTGGYLAPEILMHHPYTSAVDMWAFGVLLYLLLCGRLPFAASTHLRPNQKLTSLFRLTFPAKYWSDVSPEARGLVERILVLNPRKRLTAKDALNHEWLQQ